MEDTLSLVWKTKPSISQEQTGLTSNGQPATKESATFKLTEHCTNLSSEGLNIEEFVTEDSQKKVWVIHIPKHFPRRPVIVYKKAWQRIKDSLVPMTKERMDAILSEPIVGKDWSAEIIPDATLQDLDPKAIRLARDKYKELHSKRIEEIDSWDDMTFLNKAHITRQGKITNTAIILVDREESSHFISPAVCQIRWQLKDGSDFKCMAIKLSMKEQEDLK